MHSKSDSCVIAAGQHHSIHELVDCESIALYQICCGSIYLADWTHYLDVRLQLGIFAARELVNQVEHTECCHNLGQRGDLTRLSLTLAKQKISLLSVKYGPVRCTDVRGWILEKEFLLGLHDFGTARPYNNFHL